jgi:hypothetical protein
MDLIKKMDFLISTGHSRHFVGKAFEAATDAFTEFLGNALKDMPAFNMKPLEVLENAQKKAKAALMKVLGIEKGLEEDKLDLLGKNDENDSNVASEAAKKQLAIDAVMKRFKKSRTSGNGKLGAVLK